MFVKVVAMPLMPSLKGVRLVLARVIYTRLTPPIWKEVGYERVSDVVEFPLTKKVSMFPELETTITLYDKTDQPSSRKPAVM
jgi:hypothetical protein